MKETTIEVAFHNKFEGKDSPPVFSSEVTYFGDSPISRDEAIEQVKQAFIQDFYDMTVSVLDEEAGWTPIKSL